MREIKFRAWYKVHKRIVKIWGINWDGFNNEQIANGFCSDTVINGEYVFKADEIELMQYTGLKDKNGVEIYEGDVIKINCRTGRKGEYIDKNCQVVYNTASFVAEEIPYGGIRYELNGLCEVIGNIYQNPDLLK